MYNDSNQGYRDGKSNLSGPSNGDWGAWKAGRSARAESDFWNNQSTPNWGGSSWTTPQSSSGDASSAAFILLVWWALKITALVVFVTAWLAVLAPLGILRILLGWMVQLRRIQRLKRFVRDWVGPARHGISIAFAKVQQGGSAIASKII